MVGDMDTTTDNARDWLKVHEVAAAEQVNPKTVRRWIAKGAIPAERNPGGRTLRIPANYREHATPQAGE